MGGILRSKGVQVQGQEQEEKRVSKRHKMPTRVFQFDEKHSLFSDKTRRCEENQETGVNIKPNEFLPTLSFRS